MKRIFLFASAVFIAAGCNTDRYTIKGNLPDLDRPYVYLCSYPGELEIIDSATVDKGVFVFCGHAGEPKVAYLSYDKEQPFCRFFLENGRMTVGGNVTNGEVVVKGTAANDALVDFNELTYNTGEQYRVTEADADREQLTQKYIQQMREVLDRNRDNICGMIVLVEAAPAFLSPGEMIEQIDLFSDRWRQRDEMVELRRMIEQRLRVAVGCAYVDITAPDTAGNETALSSVVANPAVRYVLVDFWASWCAPCMMEVPYLKEAYANYRARGFEIYGVSFDTDPERLRSTLKNNDMQWIQVCDGKGFESPAAENYAVESIPANFLIRTSDGEIVATQLRGAALGDKLAELLAE